MRANVTFVQTLRLDGDEVRVERARDEGLITARQASNALKFIRAAKAIRANPTRTQLVQVGTQLVGETVFDGTAWQGRRYGKGYPNGPTFATLDAVRSDLRCR